MEYDWYFRGNVTESSRSGNTLYLRTSSTFSYASVQARARNSAGWSGFSYSKSFYKNSSCYKTGEDMTESIVDREINIYPNPLNTGQKLIIDSKSLDSQSTLIKVYDLGGVELMSKKIDGYTELDMSGFASGIYVISLSKKEVIRTEKLVIQ